MKKCEKKIDIVEADTLSEIGGERMLPSKEIINSLLELDLNKYEAKVYLTLIEEGISTAKNVSDITGIPYGKIYEIITSLCGKGFALILPTKPMKCKAISPQEVLINERKKQSEKFNTLESMFSEELMPLFTNSKKFDEPKSIFWVVNGRANINKKVETLIKKANKNIYLHLSENSLKRMSFQKTILKEAAERGVSINIITKLTKDNKEDSRLLDFCNITNTKQPITNNIISVDGEESIMVEAIPDDDNFMRGRDLGIWVLSKAFTKCMESFLSSSNSNGSGNGNCKDKPNVPEEKAGPGSEIKNED